jgi:hypothetical protein
MPMAPNLPPDQMAQAQAGAGLNPVNFLIAAADMHNRGQLSAPVPTGKALQQPSKSRPPKLKVMK